jgi:hypothetical protein
MGNVSKRAAGLAVAALLVTTMGVGCSSKPNAETVAAAQRAESAAAKAESAAARAEAAAGRVEEAARRAEAAAQKTENIFMKHMRK